MLKYFSLILLIQNLLFSNLSLAEEMSGFKVVSASTHLQNKTFLMNADLKIQFTPVILEALNNGVPITLRIDISINRHRDYIWDENIKKLSQYYRIELHALSERYLLINTESGVSHNFRFLEDAIYKLSKIRNLPIIKETLLKAGTAYYGEVEVSIDIESLPPPIQPIAYLDKDWRLSSEEKTWLILP